MANVKFMFGNYSDYVGLAQKSEDTLYFCSEGKLFKGSIEYGNQVIVVDSAPVSPIDGKIYVNSSDGSATYYDNGTPITVVPEIIDTIGDATPDTDLANVKAIKDFVVAEIGKIPAAKDYTVTLVDDATADGELTKQTIKQGKNGSESEVGTIVVPDLKMEVKATPNDGYLKTYQFTYGTGTTFEIDIPKDLVVKSGEVIVVDDTHPISGLTNGTYLKLVIVNQDEPVYIDVKDLGGSDGITPHIDSVTKHWFIGETDTGILAEGVDGNDGITPSIGANGNWFIGDTDTGVKAQGKDGKSIKSITKDDNNNIIVTFSDNTTQNIGKLSIDVQADFLTSDGFGKLRYYNGHFQYYNESTSTWVDTSVTPDNVYVMNMTPLPMKSIACDYDKLAGKLRIKFTEPDDTILDGQAFCVVEKVVIRRKLGSVPLDENDGELVTEVLRRDFGNYSKLWYVDEGVTPEIGKTYYYKAFPMSTTGFYNYSELNEANVTCKETVLYGFKIDQNESDPASMITYLSDCDNAQYASAYMDYSADTFNYGDWENAWFIKDLKPCMLKYDGTVDYELDPNDYTKKIDGTQSDVANKSYGGNAMIGFPKVYWKIVDNGDDTANVYISDTKLDNDFHCWSHIDNNGMEIDYCYLSAYDVCNINSTLRSISEQSPMTNQTVTTEINYAKSNNIGSDIIWYTGLFNDRMLINLLLLLIGKSTDTKTTFGAGNNNSYVSTSNTGAKKSGTMNTKGLFWGSNDNVSGVKVFGIENFYGNAWKRIGGWINDKGTQKIKMTYGQSDGSTVYGYNTTGNGYMVIGNSTPIGTSGGYISKVLFNENGLIPTTANGSQTTYYCDGLSFNNSQIDYALVGGGSGSRFIAGAFGSHLAHTVSDAYWFITASLSCKPLAPTT